jgi:tetratricopeptide (TPR) repeat protein
MKLRVLVILLFCVSTAYSQGTWKWPEEASMKEQAEEKNVMYNDARKQGNFSSAAEDLDWLLENTPELNSSLYVNGAKIYKELEKKATGEEKLAYQQKVMDMYDLRIKYFGDEKGVLNNKVYYAYKYYKGDKEKTEWLYQQFERTFELNGQDVGTQNLVAYMAVVKLYKSRGGDISDEEILDRYTNVMSIIDYKVSKGEDPAKLEKTKDFIDRMLPSMVTIDCEFIETNLGPKLKESGELDIAKKIMGLSIPQGCTDLDIFLEAAIVVQDHEPSFGIAKVIGAKFAGAGDFEASQKYYGMALELADDNVKKADIYFELGRQDIQRGRKSSARANLLKAVEADPSRVKSYKLIGDMYMTSYDECKKGESRVQDRAIFIAAYNMYQKAGDRKSMENAKAQFPSMEEMFNEELSEGDSKTVGCWINQVVSLQRRTES